MVMWCSDFKMLIAAGYQPGLTRVSELETIVSVAVKVSSSLPCFVHY